MTRSRDGSNKAPRTYAEKTTSIVTVCPPAGDPAATTARPTTTDGIPPTVPDVHSSTTRSVVEAHDQPSGDSSDLQVRRPSTAPTLPLTSPPLWFRKQIHTKWKLRNSARVLTLLPPILPLPLTRRHLRCQSQLVQRMEPIVQKKPLRPRSNLSRQYSILKTPPSQSHRYFPKPGKIF